jgi:hypothetical protein
VLPGGCTIREAVFDRTTADRAKYGTGRRLDTHEPSDNISLLLVRGVANNIDVLHNDICSASGLKGTIHLGDLEGRASLRLDFLIEIPLVFASPVVTEDPYLMKSFPSLERYVSCRNLSLFLMQAAIKRHFGWED